MLVVTVPFTITWKWLMTIQLSHKPNFYLARLAPKLVVTRSVGHDPRTSSYIMVAAWNVWPSHRARNMTAKSASAEPKITDVLWYMMASSLALSYLYPVSSICPGFGYTGTYSDGESCDHSVVEAQKAGVLLPRAYLSYVVMKSSWENQCKSCSEPSECLPLCNMAQDQNTRIIWLDFSMDWLASRQYCHAAQLDIASVTVGFIAICNWSWILLKIYFLHSSLKECQLMYTYT